MNKQMLVDGDDTVTPGRPRGRPSPEDTAEIEKRLLAVALEEFLQHGYGGASMNRIIRAARVSKTTLWSRFSSKEELFRAIVSEQIERLSAATALTSGAGRLDLEQGLKSYANHTLTISLSGDLLQVNRLIYSESHRFPELGAAAAERTQLGIGQISEFIQQCAVADGIPCRDPDGVAESFIFMLRGWYVNVMLTNRTVSTAVRRQWIDRAVHTLVSARDQW
jgi:TetR/AcrR family transcriptional regulator, mexJK operon transcriptional repressor